MTTNIQRNVSSHSFDNMFVYNFNVSFSVNEMLTCDCFDLVLFSRSM